MVKASQRGFTLIELVVVIVILGVLAAFAVPKFMGLEVEARKSTVNAMAGALRSAAAMAHSTQMAGGLSIDTSITVNGAAVAMSNGYPTVASLPSLIEDMTGSGFTHAAGVYSKTGAGTPATCSVTYAPATIASSVVTPPTYTIATGGC